jgi:hypothetical protein
VPDIGKILLSVSDVVFFIAQAMFVYGSAEPIHFTIPLLIERTPVSFRSELWAASGLSSKEMVGMMSLSVLNELGYAAYHPFAAQIASAVLGSVAYRTTV